MSAPDMDVIKEIPGYKVILKAVLKSQIQQLVETLAAHTDEESVILTASVSDGTLSHLGSDSGKYFLEDHEDVKSQFLGFCLKRHHRKKQSENEALKNPPVVQPQFGMGSGYSRPSFSPRTRMSMPRQSTPRHSMVPQGGYRPSPRHEPYPMGRPMKRPSQDDQTMGASVLPPSSTVGSAGVKVEPADNDSSDLNSSAVPSSSQINNDSSDSTSGASKVGTAESKPGNSISGMDESTQDSNLSSDATLPNTPNAQTTENNESDLDPNVSVKFENLNQNEMDLEITGVELGKNDASQEESWVPDTSIGMPYDPSALAGNQLDLSAGSQDYNYGQRIFNFSGRSTHGRSLGFNHPKNVPIPDGTMAQFLEGPNNSVPSANDMAGTESAAIDADAGHGMKLYQCTMCGKICATRWKLDTHFRIHSGEKPFECQVCYKRFNAKGNLKTHMLTHMHVK